MRLSLGLVIFGTLGIIIGSYILMDYGPHAGNIKIQECYEAFAYDGTFDRVACLESVNDFYRYAAFVKDIGIALVLSGIFIEVRDIKKTLRGPDQREKDK
jgi:hypothetical protein